jgi:hypothetical protein
MTSASGPLGRLVSYQGHDGIRLDGMLYTAPNASRTVVHVHGSFGNFFQNLFVRVLAAALQRHRCNLLAVNVTAHDGVAEGYYQDGRFGYIGGSLSRFETCVEDIAGACRLAQDLGPPLVLSGHSLGCDRVVWASLSLRLPHPLVLLAPCDSHELQRRLLNGEPVKAQQERIKRSIESGETDRLDWLPLSEYGVRAPMGWTYPNPITREAFLSISEGPPYRLFRYDTVADWRLDNLALVVTPSQDALLTCTASDVATFFISAMPRARHAVVEGDHLFTGGEEPLSSRVTAWLEQIP